MTSDRVNRHRTRQEKLNVLREHRDETGSYCVPITTKTPADNSHGSSDDFLSEFSRQQDSELTLLAAPISVSDEEANQLINDIRSRWNQHQMDLLLGNCRNSVLSSIVGPFGLGSMVAAMDKNGGNVTTVHNAKQDIYARTEDEYKRTDYAGNAYATARDQYKDGKIIENSQMIQDEYSGNYLDHSQAECDHIKPTKQYHQEGGFMQSKEDRKDFGSDPGNFAMTHNSANSSLGAKDKKDWQEKTAASGNGQTNKEAYGHDNRRVNAAIERGNKTAEKHAPTTIEKATYYGKRAAITGVAEAGKMGVQQSIGVLLTEFFSASFDEIADTYKNGFHDSLHNQSFYEALRGRLNRISERVAARWKDALVAFKEGAISGFLSNLVTMLINTLVTTGKRIVRVIREGLMSIMKALKVALFPQEGMTSAEAADAALKLIPSGILVSLGILAEDAVEKAVSAFFSANLPILAPYAGTVAAVLVGVMTGIGSALLVYGLDKLDIFGVNGAKRHAFVLQELDLLIAESDKRITTMYDQEMGRFDDILGQLQRA